MSSRTPNKIKGDVVVAFSGVVTFERTQRVVATVNDVDTRPQDHEIKMLEWWANKGHMGASMIDVIVATKGKHILQSEPWEVADKPKTMPTRSGQSNDGFVPPTGPVSVPFGPFSLDEARIIYESAVNLSKEGWSDPYTAFMDFLNSGGYRP